MNIKYQISVLCFILFVMITASFFNFIKEKQQTQKFHEELCIIKNEDLIKINLKSTLKNNSLVSLDGWLKKEEEIYYVYINSINLEDAKENPGAKFISEEFKKTYGTWIEIDNHEIPIEWFIYIENTNSNKNSIKECENDEFPEFKNIVQMKNIVPEFIQALILDH